MYIMLFYFFPIFANHHSKQDCTLFFFNVANAMLIGTVSTAKKRKKDKQSECSLIIDKPPLGRCCTPLRLLHIFNLLGVQKIWRVFTPAGGGVAKSLIFVQHL